VIEILNECSNGKQIVQNFIDNDESYLTHEDRKKIVSIVCLHLVKVDPLKHFPTTETKHRYAKAIIASFPCLGTKVKDAEGNITLTHEVFYDPVAGGYIENKLKDMRRSGGIRKRKLNVKPSTATSVGTSGENNPPMGKKSKEKPTKGTVSLEKQSECAADEEMMVSMVNFIF
jgi:hypothetical protein